MKKVVALLMCGLLCVGAPAQTWDFNNSGSRIFDMSKNQTEKTVVTVRYVPAARILEACNAQSREFGFNGFPGGALACSWNWPDRCYIILPEKVDMRTVGHEFLHCLQGQWH